jgi:chloride channel protein, CIC family
MAGPRTTARTIGAKIEGEPRLLLESAVLGVAGALSAQAFMWMLRLCNRLLLQGLAGYQAPGMETHAGLVQRIGPHGLWLIPLVTTLGGLLSGILVYSFAPEAEGHGTDTVVNAFHRQQGLIRPRVAPLKMVASAITIGSGGAAGREGPIALITATIGSFYARLTHRTEEERRLLLLAGMAAGLSAIFRSPMGTSIFAIEVLYGEMEFEVGALLYTMCSSAVAYAVNGLFVGFAPLFSLPRIAIPSFASYGWYAVLGIAAGIIGTLLPVVFYRVRDLFRALPIPLWMRPGLGGLGVGLLALRLPQVLQGGYGWMQLAMDGRMALGLMLVLVFAKTVAFALTVSSGGSGGVFAPSLFVGAMLGGACALVAHQSSAVFVVVGMAAVFGAAARVPIATMFMVTEMAGGFHLLVPAGMAVMIAYLLQDRLSVNFKYRSLYEAQVANRTNSPAHYMEHIQIAMRLLGKRDLHVTTALGHLDLLRLMRSRVRFDLPEKKELDLELVTDASPLIGKTISWLYRELRGYEFEIVAILRREQVLLPHLDAVVEAEDELMFITSTQAGEPLSRYLSPIPEDEKGGVQISAPGPPA